MATPALVGLTAWRLVVAACGFVGFGAAVAVMADPWPALSQQASLLTGVVYVVLALYPLFTRADLPGSTWLRGAVCVLLLLVAGTYMSLMEGDLGSVHSLFEHMLTPLVVLADWVLVGGGQAQRVRWWFPVSWLVFPLAYLGYFLVERPHLYRAFLDPDDSGFAGTVAAFMVAILAAGFALCGIAKVRAWTG
ncbi:Pr6Pr family membrane protein [Actinophytocola sp.]|uniref:Pr6Pr family membrane protein n=1 Tax=Actinophytocola sp. TaxID=1872138 RepID=UPI002ED0D98F